MDKIRLGIIGFGNMGTTHAKNVNSEACPDIILTAIADIKESRLEAAKAAYKDVACFKTAEEMFDSGKIDACIVAVPHYDHTTLAIKAIKKGIHVMVEKPAGVYTKQVEEMNAVADENPDVVFGMMFNQRTNCLYRKMRELVQSGEYGEIRRTSWIITNWYRPQAYYDSGDWRATWAGEGGGVLLNQSPHQLDLWQWICGMPVKIHAKMKYGKWHNIEVEDDVTAYVEYANGATGTFITTTGDAYGTNRFEVQMDKAKLVVEDGKLRVWEFEMTEQEFSATNKRPFAHIETKEIEIETDGLNEQHIGVMNAFANKILGKGELIAKGQEGINGLTISNAMHLSDFLDKEIVLPIDADLFKEELMKRVSNSNKVKDTVEVFEDNSSSFGNV